MQQRLFRRRIALRNEPVTEPVEDLPLLLGGEALAPFADGGIVEMAIVEQSVGIVARIEHREPLRLEVEGGNVAPLSLEAAALRDSIDLLCAVTRIAR